MAKNEAKVKFTAETGSFNEEIKKTNNTMTELRAELRLNETQMKATGATVEGLEKKHSLLSAQLEQSRAKEDALTEKIKVATKYFGENSDEVSKLRTQLANTKNSTEKLNQAVNSAKKEMDDFGDSAEGAKNGAESASEGFTVMKGVVADLASEAIQMAIGKISEFVGYLAELPEATRELRQDLSTLTTSFDTMGFSTETATDTWKELYAVFGEDDRAVEAANHISKMSENQEDLNDWVTITTGVWGTYQDSLPVEGLAEASLESAKCGKVTGVLADALNWSGEAAVMFADKIGEGETAEDGFNKALAECATEQERQQLITDTLTALYGEAAETYRDTAGAQMEAKEATADQMLAENELAESIEPVTTAFTELKTELIEAFAPAIETVSGLMLDALEWAKEHPVAMQVIAGVVGTLALAFTGLAIGLGVYSAAQWIANASFAAFLAPAAGIIAAIAAIVAIVIIAINYWDEIVAAVKSCITKMRNAWKSFTTWLNNNVIKPMLNWFKNLWKGITNTFKNVGTWFKNKFVAAKNGVLNAWKNVKTWFSNLWSGIRNVFGNVGTWFKNKFVAAKNGVVNAFSSIKSFFGNIYSNIKSTFAKVKNAIVSPFTTAINKVKSLFNKVKFSFPSIKLPHFSVTPKGWKIGDLLKGSIPRLGISWYKEGGIMTNPTVFGLNGSSLMAGGEAGPEAILPIDKLEGYIENVVERSMQVVNLQSLANAIEDLANRPIEMNINGRQFALATASDSDNINGLRNTFKSRGLALE